MVTVLKKHVAGVRVIPLHPTIGAEIEGVDLSRPLADDLRSALRTLLVKHRVIFFRDQHITRSQQIEFARSFGSLDTYSYGDQQEQEFIEIYNDENTPPNLTNHWHCDTTGWRTPSMGVVLHALEVPEVGGDTLFTDMIAAYEGLPKDIKIIIDKLTAIHDERGIAAYSNDVAGLSAQINLKYPPQEHPVVRTHPESGEKILFVNSLLTQRLCGIPEVIGRPLLEYLCAQATVPEYQVRFHWRPGSVAFWDNRSTQHYASGDYFPARRRLDRVSIVGDRPY